MIRAPKNRIGSWGREEKLLPLPPPPVLPAFPFRIEGESAGRPAGCLELTIALFLSGASVLKVPSSGGGGVRAGNEAGRELANGCRAGVWSIGNRMVY